MSLANADTADLIPLNQALRNEIPGNPSISTVWRWATRGLAPAVDGEPRIKLEVLYCGNRPYTTEQAIREFLQRVTAARLARIATRRPSQTDVTEDELRAAGLV